MKKIENSNFGSKRKGFLFDNLKTNYSPGVRYGIFSMNDGGMITFKRKKLKSCATVMTDIF